jgi:hypothetical protein
MKLFTVSIFLMGFQFSASAANFLCVSHNGTRDGADYFQTVITDDKIKVTTGRGSFSLNTQDFLVTNQTNGSAWIYQGASEFSMLTQQGSSINSMQHFSFRLLSHTNQIEISYQILGDGYWHLFEGVCRPIELANACMDLL